MCTHFHATLCALERITDKVVGTLLGRSWQRSLYLHQGLAREGSFVRASYSETETSIMVHASHMAFGAVLQQYTDHQWCAASFFSTSVSPTERRYSYFGRGLLAIYLGIKHFRYFLEG